MIHLSTVKANKHKHKHKQALPAKMLERQKKLEKVERGMTWYLCMVDMD